ncbi:tRNA glutamyl-Q(34) synthetase GluQRS [Luteolibacter sp. AS25]|uniref:tRNA glutamyl-Q(34) synthetase GluQRS n=1 Tax=Luteolibacter sp. AS25 TaxID=3135776 RepID=UPI00398B44C7
MKPISRFAPSPTGYLHLGHAYAARIAYETAREKGGTFLLRHEDIDTSRVRPEFFAAIEEDLKWLGLNWDGEPLIQSTRIAAYEEVLEKLKSMGLLYPCFCTRKEIQATINSISNAPQDGAEQTYPKTCHRMSQKKVDQKIRNGESHSWRFDSEKAAEIHGPLTFNDLERGETGIDISINGDVVLARKDVGIAYHLAVVVDDEFQDVTHVTRGEDLFFATHVQRQLQEILGYREPIYRHHELINDEDGNRLAKRHDSLAIKTLRERGFSPAEVLDMI